MSLNKVAVIGEKQIVTAFRAVGFTVFFADAPSAATDILRELVKSGEYAVIFITEDIAAQMHDTLEILKSRSYPIIVPLPSLEKNGYGMECIKKDVEKAVGVDILFNKDESSNGGGK